MATQGTAVLDFGAFPGASDASVAVASAGIGAGSLVEAWLTPIATASHSADEHRVETLAVMAGNVQAGVGFTVYGRSTNQVSEPDDKRSLVSRLQEPRLYGLWSVGWVWNT